MSEPGRNAVKTTGWASRIALIVLCLSGLCAAAGSRALQELHDEDARRAVRGGRCAEAQAFNAQDMGPDYCGKYGTDYASPRVTCYLGEYCGEAYATHGSVSEGVRAPVPFHIVLAPRDGAWRVVDWDYVDE